MLSVQKKSELDLTTIVLHWTVATLAIGLFLLGYWMLGLDYYDPWYYQAPLWHKSLGVVLFIGVLLQGVWQFYRAPILSLLAPKSWQLRLSSMMHFSLLIFIYSLIVTGYFIVTGQGQSLAFFDWFSIPAVMDVNNAIMPWVGDIHCYSAYALMILVGLHFFAALKHHFVDQDAVLKRMLGQKGER